MSLADDQAFESFVRAYGTTLIRLAGALTGDPDVGEEVVQSALERLFVRWRRVDDPLAYARQVVVNLCKDRGRGAVRRERAGLPFAEIAAPDVIGMHDDRDQLVRAVRALPYRQRAVRATRHQPIWRSGHAWADCAGPKPAACAAGCPRRELPAPRSAWPRPWRSGRQAAVPPPSRPGPAFVTLVKAADVSGSLAAQSGTTVVRITHDGHPWTAATIRWNGHDLSVSRDVSGRRGFEFRVVDGNYYDTNPVTGHWHALGSAEGFDPRTGTTPREYLATVKQDAGGATLHRIVGAMTGLSTRHLADGSAVYSGSVPAGAIAREQGYKEGQSIRVLPFGYVAHDEAADPAAPLAVRLTVGADGIIRLIAVHWGSSFSAWDYTVAYSGLGHTPAPAAPENATPRR
jgi:hypothetical protein